MAEHDTARPPYLPGARISNLVVAIGLCALGWALYMRYVLIENSTIGLACEAGAHTGTCAARRVAIVLFNHGVFGYAAIAAAVLHLIHPHTLLFTVALATGAVGVVLYNGQLSALALALLAVSFARPQPPAPMPD